MCNETKTLKIRVPADLSHTGRAFWKRAKIDACIADIVEALQSAGIDMRSSCCGHGVSFGHIILQDGRELVIIPSKPVTDGIISPELMQKLRDRILK